MNGRLAGLAVVGLAGLVGSSALAVAPTAYPRPGHTERVSLGAAGAQASYPTDKSGTLAVAAYRYASDISADGRYVAFMSDATNLVPHLATKAGLYQIFRRDRLTGRTELVSESTDGTPGLTTSLQPSISGDGRYIAFSSDAPNLVPGDTNAATDVFWHDMSTHRTVRVSVATGGAQTTVGDGSGAPSLSDDGQLVAFESRAANLAPGTTASNAWSSGVDQYVRDLRSRKTTLVSLGLDGSRAGGRYGSISGNGRYVAFTGSTGLTRTVTRSHYDVYVRDLKARTTVLASMASDGTPAQVGAVKCGGGTPPADLPEPVGSLVEGYSTAACAESDTGSLAAARVISNDGRYVTFTSNATNLVPNVSRCADPVLPFCAGVYLHDMWTGRTERLDVNSLGQPMLRQATINEGIGLSGNGRYVAYTYGGPNDHTECPYSVDGFAVPSAVPLTGACDKVDVYVYDRVAGTQDWVSTSTSGREPTPGRCYPLDLTTSSESYLGAISDDGRHLSFYSAGTDLVPGDTNNHCDVFVRDRGTLLGVGGLSGTPVASSPSPGCGLPVCPPTPAGAGLQQARVSPRQGLQDLFIRWDVSRMAPVAGAPSGGLLYELRFTSGGQHYAVRAQRIAGPDFDVAGGASFGLFRQTTAGLWMKVASLKGGYGTIGDSVVTAVPLSLLGGTAQLTDVTAYTAVGSYLSGATKVLDSIKLTRPAFSGR